MAYVYVVTIFIAVVLHIIKGLLNVCVCDSICAICGHLWPFDNSEKMRSLSDDTAVCFQTEPLHTDSGADLHPAAAAATRREKRKL